MNNAPNQAANTSPMPRETTPHLVSPKLASRSVSLSTSKLAKLRYENKGPRFYKFGKAVRYATGDLLDWAKNCQVSTDCTEDANAPV